MSRDDERNLKQTIEVPIGDFVQDIAEKAGRAAARECIEEHIKSCPIGQKLELRWAKVLGIIIGSTFVVNLVWTLLPVAWKWATVLVTKQ